MKINLYAKAVLNVVAIATALFVFQQEPFKEAHAGAHSKNLGTQLSYPGSGADSLESSLNNFRNQKNTIAREVAALGSVKKTKEFKTLLRKFDAACDSKSSQGKSKKSKLQNCREVLSDIGAFTKKHLNRAIAIPNL